MCGVESENERVGVGMAWDLSGRYRRRISPTRHLARAGPTARLGP